MFPIAGSLHRQHLQAPSPSARKPKSNAHGVLSLPTQGDAWIQAETGRADISPALGPEQAGPTAQRKTGKKKGSEEKMQATRQRPWRNQSRLALFPPAHPGLSFKTYSQRPILFRPPVFFFLRALVLLPRGAERGWERGGPPGLPKTVWPSGLRRWLKAPFRKGVGSNPTGVILQPSSGAI